MGDINIEVLKFSNTEINNYITALEFELFISTITKATSFPNKDIDVPYCNDHIWMNLIDCSRSGIINMDLIDHCPTFRHFTPTCSVMHKAPIEFSSRSYFKSNEDVLVRELK